VVVIVSCGITMIVSDFTADAFALSSTLATNENVPATVGVPLSTPEAFMTTPDGADPEKMDHV
jgi:hypothetical protein